MIDLRSRLRQLCAVVALAGLSACAKPAHLTGVAVDTPAPEIRLAQDNGAAFVLSAQRGKVVVVFFGYTHCTDVCPLTMAHLAAAARRLPAGGPPVVPVFISVDPERDTPAASMRYARRFSPSAIGLSGTSAALAPVFHAYHVWAQRLPSKSKTDYEMAHVSTMYVIDPRGRLRVLEDWDTPIAALTHDLQAVAQ